MKLKIDIPDYDGNAMDVIWNKGAEYTLDIVDNEIIMTANSCGLISIATQMLYMAYNQLPEGSHVHYDEFFTKINSKYNFVICKKSSKTVDGEKKKAVDGSVS